MKKDDYCLIARDPKVWFHYANVQKKVADSILDSMMDKQILEKEKEGGSIFYDLWINAHYHYGIGLENGMKGLIVKNKPEEVIIEELDNKVSLKGIGKRRNTKHNLLILAEDAGIFNMSIYKYESDIKALRAVLKHLSDAIKWLPKYPIPLNNEAEYVFDNSVPPVLVYGFHILDVVEPLFELFRKEET